MRLVAGFVLARGNDARLGLHALGGIGHGLVDFGAGGVENVDHADETGAKGKEKSASKVDDAVVKSVERFLKLHYLRTRSDSACRDILYGRDKVFDLELFLNLSGRSRMTAAGFEALIKHLKFEDALQYVAIPAIKIDAAAEGLTPRSSKLWSKNDQKPLSDATGRDDLVQVFEGVRKKGVKTIIKVVVEDTLSPPHTNEAIEKSLGGMGVEVWDSTFLSMEMHLYWGGSNAVLRGWSEEAGLNRLVELRTHAWIDCMTKVRKILNNIALSSPNINEEAIKVALIDDGVDFTELDYPPSGGRTFCLRDEENNLNHPHYASATGHGTIMAKLIQFMCPQVQLRVLRLEDHPSEKARQISARSAAQAITEAVKRGVDIISMSLTIDPPEDETVKADLDKTIHEADKAHILMFCSASDQGAISTDTYPSKATQRIFTIGTAGPWGETNAWVGNPDKVNPTFPGDRVEIMHGGATSSSSNNGGSAREATGSSVATALVAGFTALMLYCVQVKLHCTDEKDKQRMTMAFRNTIWTTPESRNKFIPIWELFRKAIERMDRADHGELIHLVSEIGDRVCMGV
ncbi:peptidase S8/S53 domain-containing protein [Podospora fimiseda]|uniref:Peptidase S8/S53 domain-containing protein n=1 Tax=Podospora fimiseda TaxID=252190 RepID=A0AAN7BHK5_9PEZI|nr:peptidase S8/S53 domain-containing protein [Podospora fimiseda]